MRTSQYLLATKKEIPSDAESISHKLMLRSGMIQQVTSGIYTWLPTGLRVLKKIENIVREEMNNTRAIEVSMPMVQPTDLWKESGRFDQYGPELLSFFDRHKRHYILGPTHEELITALVRNQIKSYKQLPITFFQIQTKFRDEIRPRFGVMRAREFLMKDAYSFHTTQESLQETYDIMYDTYCKILSRVGLNFRAVEADTGSIGGNRSHEFQVFTDSGEDEIVFSTNSNFASNIKLTEVIAPNQIRAVASTNLSIIDTKNSINEQVQQNRLPIEKTVQIFFVNAVKESGHELIALFLRGDHQLNKIKIEKLPQVYNPLTFANQKKINEILKKNDNDALYPIHLNIPMIADQNVFVMSDFSISTNINGKNYFGINWERDLPLPQVADIRNVVVGDVSPDGKGTLLIKRGIEVGHIFQLGTRYSEIMQATIENKEGKKQAMTMGCYGIGMSRLVAASIEQNYDKYGIIWPEAIAPFQVAIVPISLQKSLLVQEQTEYVYRSLSNYGIDVILDDRKYNPGSMLADMELIGVPHRIVISESNLHNQNVEYKNRSSSDKKMIKIDKIIDFLITKIAQNNNHY